MTRDQWKVWEDSLDLAPEVMQEMYKPLRMEITEQESLDLARADQEGASRRFALAHELRAGNERHRPRDREERLDRAPVETAA